MRIEVISIGDEVLAGYTVNSNAAMISRALGGIGLEVTSHRVLPDSDILPGLRDALDQNDLVICCGGLGPTIDDKTRRAVADLFECKLVYNEEVGRRLGEIPTRVDQATIPELAQPFHNSVGTAPGLVLEGLILLPGVPVELEAMLKLDVIPYLARTCPAQRKRVQTIHIFQVPEAEVDEVIRANQMEAGIYPHLGLVTVRAENVDPLAKAYPNNHFFGDSLQQVLQDRCVEQGLTLATAESCTGGAIAASLTQIPGASEYFLGGCITYSNEIKEQLLGVSHQTLLDHGAVSRETAVEMVEGLLERMQCDVGVAVTGIAGPSGGTEEKPVGTVWTAVARKGSEPVASLIHARGNRAAIIQRTVNHALAEVLILSTRSGVL